MGVAIAGANKLQCQQVLEELDRLKKEKKQGKQMSSLKIYKFFLNGLLKLARLSPQTIEIEPGTVINIRVPTEVSNDTSKQRKEPAIVFIRGFGLDDILTGLFQALALAKDYSVYMPNLVFLNGPITDETDRSVKFQAECMTKGSSPWW